jgi:plasmid stabilization system protein ParE
LEAAVRFIARDNPTVAAQVGNKLIDKVAILQNFPEVWPQYSKRPGVRFLVSRPCVIFYRPRLKQNCVDILRYWHGAPGEPEL